MSTTSSPAQSQPEPLLVRLRNVFIGTLFALVLLVPKLLQLRRNARSWMLFRILMGVAGAALVVVPLGLWNSYLLSLLGLAMFVGSILLPPLRPLMTVDEKARELGALVVVNGGRYRPTNAPPAAVQFFVGPDHIWVLDEHFESLLAISVNQMTAARAEESGDGWLLRVAWAGHAVIFSYRGLFAGRLARVAESTLQNVMRPSRPVISRTRAAGA